MIWPPSSLLHCRLCPLSASIFSWSEPPLQHSLYRPTSPPHHTQTPSHWLCCLLLACFSVLGPRAAETLRPLCVSAIAITSVGGGWRWGRGSLSHRQVEEVVCVASRRRRTFVILGIVQCAMWRAWLGGQQVLDCQLILSAGEQRRAKRGEKQDAVNPPAASRL